jgi:hypothetical protein
VLWEKISKSGALTNISPTPYGLGHKSINFRLDQNSTTAIMGRLHSNGKGISASAIPYSRTPPTWLKTAPEQIVEQICRLAKKGATPSQIGVVLRDAHGIAQVKVVTGIQSAPGTVLRTRKLIDS